MSTSKTMSDGVAVAEALREYFTAKDAYNAEFLILQTGDAARRLAAARVVLEDLRERVCAAQPGKALSEGLDDYTVRNLVNYFGADLFNSPGRGV